MRCSFVVTMVVKTAKGAAFVAGSDDMSGGCDSASNGELSAGPRGCSVASLRELEDEGEGENQGANNRTNRRGWEPPVTTDLSDEHDWRNGMTCGSASSARQRKGRKNREGRELRGGLRSRGEMGRMQLLLLPSARTLGLLLRNPTA